MKVLTNLAIIAGLALPLAATFAPAPAHADEGIIVQHRVVERRGPAYRHGPVYHRAHYRHHRVPVTRCHWVHHRRVCNTVWVRR